MITEITYTHPSPNINIGGSEQKYSAKIKFDICIDSGRISYKSILIKGVCQNNWSIEDLSFIQSCLNIITLLSNKTLSEANKINSHLNSKE